MSVKDVIDSFAALLGVVAWPLVVIVLLVRYRIPISELITRLSEMAMLGGSAKFHPPAQVVPPRAELERQKELASKEASTDLLARVTLWWWFEKNWNAIYRDQIAILERVAAAPQHRVELNGIVTTPVKMLNPEFVESRLPQYVDFLQRAGFVTLDYSANPNNPIVALTEWGTAFLDYISEQGYTKEMKVY